MFKQIFENKIGEKLNNFNNSGKVAFEWMDKFRQSLDITEKIQQQFNYNNSTNSSSSPPSQSSFNTPNSTLNNNNDNLIASAAQSSAEAAAATHSALNSPASNNNSNLIINHHGTSYLSNGKKKELRHANSVNSNNTTNHKNLKINFNSDKDDFESTEHIHNLEDTCITSSNNQSPPTSPVNLNSSPASSFSSLLSPRNSIKSSKQKLSNTSQHQHNPQQQDSSSSMSQLNQSNDSNANNNEFSLSSSSSISQKSAEFTNSYNQHQHLQQSKSIAEETVYSDNLSLKSSYTVAKSNSAGSHHQARMLVRQSTDLTSSFPLKPFQKINSETVEIPGLNVKVVRYRIENDLGKIEPHLYINYNAGGIEANSTAIKGKMYFSLRYNEEIQSFSVTITKADIYNNCNNNNLSSNNNLKPPSSPNTSSLLNASSSTNQHSKSMPSSPNLNKPDTYVKVQLLPDKKRKYQTRIQRKNCQPIFEETFYFQLPFEELQNKTLYLTHLEFGRFSKHELIGAVRISDLNLIKDLQTSDVEFVRSLVQLAEDDLELGELSLTLCYLPAAGRLTVTIVKAINLKAMDINGKSDPYVKVTLVTKGKRLKKKKTSVMKNTLNPVYNESMLFDIPQDQIEQVDMLVKVIDYDRVGSNELIGCVGIGPSFNGIGRDHWYRMIENPRKPITQSYYLRDSSFLREGLPAKVEKALNSSRQESVDSRNSDY